MPEGERYVYVCMHTYTHRLDGFAYKLKKLSDYDSALSSYYFTVHLILLTNNWLFCLLLLTQFFSSGPIVCMCWEGKDIIKQGRVMLGETQPLASNPGSIRGDYSIDLGRNICHGSDSPDSAAHELKMWFGEGVNDWAKSVDSSVYE
jgi:nucleoside diphosphate kinase